MAKNLFLYGRFLLAAVCLCLLPCSSNVAQPYPATPAKATQQFRPRLSAIYTAELGVKESTGTNDGTRVEEYLRYTGLGKGNEWCAAFVCWCYHRAGRQRPRNPWGPSLFPKVRVVWQRGKPKNSVPRPGDVFGSWNNSKKRISHVGFVAQWDGKYLITTEGNSNNAVERRRRPVSTIYKVADWTTIPQP